MRFKLYSNLTIVFILIKCLIINSLTAQTRLLSSSELQQKKVFYSIQEALTSGEKVYRLDLSNQDLNTLDRDITKLTNLQELNISGNLFQELPSEIYQLSRLQILNADNNQIYKISEMVVILQNLEELYLIGNPILEVSYQIQNLPRLRKLELSQNLTFELYQSDNNFQNLTLLSIVNNSLLKVSESDASAEINASNRLRKPLDVPIERKYSSVSKNKKSILLNTPKIDDQKHLKTISGLQKDKNHLEQKVSSLAKDLDQSQNLHKKLAQEKDSVLQAKKAVLAEKKRLEEQIQAKTFYTTLLVSMGVVLILALLGVFIRYSYKVKNNVGSLQAKLDEQEEELEDNEDIIRQQAHIISEQSQILKSIKDEDRKQNLSY